MTIEGERHLLARDEAVALRDRLEAAITDRQTFVRTAGIRRADGTYVVTRRGADSTGNSKVFESVDALRRLYERLPERITAEAIGTEGITGSRRHMLVRHFAEHPGFDCAITCRSPLTARKGSSAGERPTEAETD